MRFLPATSTHAEGAPAACRFPKAAYPSGQRTKIPLWLFFLLLLSFGSLQVMGQEIANVEPNSNAYIDAGLPNPIVSSDKDDYSPGETAIITGSGWTLDEYVDIHLEEEPAHDHHHGYHDTKVNPDGTWEIRYPIEERHLGVKFTVIVDGKQSGYQGLAYFTDGEIVFSTSGLPDGISVTVNWSHTQGNGQSGMRTFTTPNSSDVVSVNNQSFSYSYPALITQNGVTYTFISSTYSGNISSTGNNNDRFGVIGYYEIACTPPSISSQPSNATVTYGANASFSVMASGTVDSYKWQVSKDGGASFTDVTAEPFTGYSGATSATLSIAKPTVAMSGYQYRVILSACSPAQPTISNAAALTVNAAPLTVTTNSRTKTFGQELTSVDFSGNVSTNSDNITIASFTSDGAAASATVAGGSYIISATLNDQDNRLANYTITNNYGPLTINKADATIAVDGTTVIYNGAAHGATGSATGVNGETLAGLDLGASFTNVPGGTANWTFTDETGNYNDDAGSVAIVINPRPFTIKADDQSKLCGQDDPELTYQVTSGTLVNGDSFSGSLVRASGEGEGTYAIGEGTLTLGPNYNLTVIEGEFTIIGISLDANASYVNIQVNNTGQLSATVSPAAAGIPVTFTIYEDDNTKIRTTLNGTTDAAGIATVSWTAPGTIGTYKVKVMAGSSACDASMEAYISVFDPSSSFVTGGGWFHSPAGAMPAKPDAAGKANFGFVSKYKKGKNNTNTEEVDGNTEFQFHSGGLNFKSTLHESGSLIVSGKRATYRGSGTINGQAGFKFMVVAIDGDWNGQKNPDSFRIKITTNSGDVVYDNQIDKDENSDFATILGNNGTGGGSIVIHEVQVKGNKREADAAALEEAEAEILSTTFTNYPNTFSDRTTIAFVLAKDENYSLEVYDIRGVLVTKVASGTAEAGRKYEYEVDGSRMASGMFIARLITPSGVQMLRMVKE